MNRDRQMEAFDTSFSCCNLLCQETEEACFSETERECHQSVILNHYIEDDEYIQKLVQRETDVGFKTNVSFSDCSITRKTWLECARLDAIEWIFNTRETFGFQIQTAYLSVAYFDRFISTRSIDDGKLWAIRLLSVACLSLAAKMEECRVPILSEFPIKDYQFENKVIQRMELLVLTTLEWKMSSITPFSYLHYFINKFYDEHSKPEGLISKALKHIVAIVKEISSVDHRPSIIAAAAVLAASDSRLTRKAIELKINFISLWGSLESEHVFSCYNMMKEIEMRKSKTPKFVISSNYSSVAYYGAENPAAVVSSGAGTRRRKRTFNESDDPNSLAKKICRP